MNKIAIFSLPLAAVVAAGLWCVSPGSDPLEEKARVLTKVSGRGAVGSVEESGRATKRPGRMSVLTMTGEDWRRYFRDSVDGEMVSAEFQEEIVALADELQESRSGGLDAADPEVLGYTEVIGVLLEEGSAEPELEWR